MAVALTTPAAVVNAAIQLIGGYNDQGAITGTPPNFDDSKLGEAAGAIYNEVVYAVGREFGYDFSRNIVNLAASGNTPPFPWSAEYIYPANGIQVRQLTPGVLADPNNPLPVNWDVGNTTVSSVPTKVIWTNVAGAQAVISNTPPEGLWDSLFQEAVIQALASKLAMAGVGKPDLLREYSDMGDKVQTAAVARES